MISCFIEFTHQSEQSVCEHSVSKIELPTYKFQGRYIVVHEPKRLFVFIKYIGYAFIGRYLFVRWHTYNF